MAVPCGVFPPIERARRPGLGLPTPRRRFRCVPNERASLPTGPKQLGPLGLQLHPPSSSSEVRLPLQLDVDSSQPDSSRPDSSRLDSSQPDSLRLDSLRLDSCRFDLQEVLEQSRPVVAGSIPTSEHFVERPPFGVERRLVVAPNVEGLGAVEGLGVAEGSAPVELAGRTRHAAGERRHFARPNRHELWLEPVGSPLRWLDSRPDDAVLGSETAWPRLDARPRQRVGRWRHCERRCRRPDLGPTEIRSRPTRWKRPRRPSQRRSANSSASDRYIKSPPPMSGL